MNTMLNSFCFDELKLRPGVSADRMLQRLFVNFLITHNNRHDYRCRTIMMVLIILHPFEPSPRSSMLIQKSTLISRPERT